MIRTNFNMAEENITMIRGDTLAFNVEITDNYGEPIQVDSAYFTCKKDIYSNITTFQKTLENGIEQDDGLLIVRIDPNDTKEVIAGKYFYDFQVNIGDDTYTLQIGVLAIDQDVTY